MTRDEAATILTTRRKILAAVVAGDAVDQPADLSRSTPAELAALGRGEAAALDVALDALTTPPTMVDVALEHLVNLVATAGRVAGATEPTADAVAAAQTADTVRVALHMLEPPACPAGCLTPGRSTGVAYRGQRVWQCPTCATEFATTGA